MSNERQEIKRLANELHRVAAVRSMDARCGAILSRPIQDMTYRAGPQGPVCLF
jgi:hypothetical protein